MYDRILPSVCYSGQDVGFKGICGDDGIYFVRFDIDWLEMIPVKEFAVRKKQEILSHFRQIIME